MALMNIANTRNVNERTAPPPNPRTITNRVRASPEARLAILQTPRPSVTGTPSIAIYQCVSTLPVNADTTIRIVEEIQHSARECRSGLYEHVVKHLDNRFQDLVEIVSGLDPFHDLHQWATIELTIAAYAVHVAYRAWMVDAEAGQQVAVQP